MAANSRVKSSFAADFATPGRNNLTALRLVAALCAVISQCAYLRVGDASADPLAGVTCFTLADHAINMFFFLSGLTVSASLARSRSVADFAVARALRIAPALFVATILMVFVVGPVASDLAPVAYFADPGWRAIIVKTAFVSGSNAGLPGMFSDNPVPFVVNGGVWTLKFLAVFYGAVVLAPVLASRRGPRVGNIWLPLATLAAGVLMMPLALFEATANLELLARLWFAFGLGAMAYRHPSYVFSPAFATLIAGALFWISIGHFFEGVAAVLFVAAATPFLGRVPIGPARRLANKVDLSYGLCVVAWPTTQLILVVDPLISMVPLTLSVLAIGVVLASASWLFTEKPALSSRRRLVVWLERLYGGSRIGAVAFAEVGPPRR